VNAYFEIGGHIIETHVQDQNIPGRPPKIDARSLSKELNVPAPLIRARKTGVNLATVVDSYSRKRRAQAAIRQARPFAIRAAAAFAVADGPLPFGDMIAVGVLGGYAAYEVYTAVTQLM